MLPRKAQTCQRRLVRERVRIIVDAVVMSAFGGGFLFAALSCQSNAHLSQYEGVCSEPKFSLWPPLVSVAPKLLDRWSRKKQKSDERQRRPEETFHDPLILVA